MLNDARGHLFEAPHMVVFPALAVMTAVLSFDLLGDTIQELVPRWRHRNFPAKFIFRSEAPNVRSGCSRFLLGEDDRSAAAQIQSARRVGLVHRNLEISARTQIRNRFAVVAFRKRADQSRHLMGPHLKLNGASV